MYNDFSTNVDSIKLLTSIKLETRLKDYSLLAEKTTCEEDIPKILKLMMSYIDLNQIKIVKIAGKKNTLWQLGERYCKGSIDHNISIEVLLVYESILIEVITKLIITLTLNSLKDLSYFTTCNEILDTLEIFISLIKTDGQSLHLISNMKILDNKLWLICDILEEDNKKNIKKP